MRSMRLPRVIRRSCIWRERITYDASAVLVKDHTNSWKLYYIGRDYLGSITDIITEAGTKYASYNFERMGSPT